MRLFATLTAALCIFSSVQAAPKKKCQKKSNVENASYNNDNKEKCGPPHINEDGLKMIELFEGFKECPYDDQGNTAIGYGHTCDDASCSETKKYRKPEGPNCPDLAFRPITKDGAAKMLRKQVVSFEKAIIDCIGKNVKLNANQFAALVSFAYNMGGAGACDSDVIKGLNSGKDPKTVIAQQLPKYKFAGDPPEPMLAERRNREVEFAERPTDEQALPFKKC